VLQPCTGQTTKNKKKEKRNTSLQKQHVWCLECSGLAPDEIQNRAFIVSRTGVPVPSKEVQLVRMVVLRNKCWIELLREIE